MACVVNCTGYISVCMTRPLTINQSINHSINQSINRVVVVVCLFVCSHRSAACTISLMIHPCFCCSVHVLLSRDQSSQDMTHPPTRPLLTSLSSQSSSSAFQFPIIIIITEQQTAYIVTTTNTSNNNNNTTTTKTKTKTQYHNHQHYQGQGGTRSFSVRSCPKRDLRGQSDSKMMDSTATTDKQTKHQQQINLYERRLGPTNNSNIAETRYPVKTQ